MIEGGHHVHLDGFPAGVRKIAGKALRAFVKRLPKLPEHTRCAFCGRHSGTLELPIGAIYNACVWCGFGSNEAERGREGYFDKEKREWIENGEVADRPGD